MSDASLVRLPDDFLRTPARYALECSKLEEKAQLHESIKQHQAEDALKREEEHAEKMRNEMEETRNDISGTSTWNFSSYMAKMKDYLAPTRESEYELVHEGDLKSSLLLRGDTEDEE